MKAIFFRRITGALRGCWQSPANFRPEARGNKKKRGKMPRFPYMLAEQKGLEPSASGVTGQRYNRLNYCSALYAVLVGGVGIEPTALGL